MKWVNYFKELFNQNSDKCNFHSYINTASNVFLDKDISENELIKAISSFNTGKASGIDSISIETIKCGKLSFLKPLCKLYNLILDSSCFLVNWNTYFIVPIHKNGSLNDPKNYRPTVISNTLSKIFSKILCERLVEFFHENRLWSENQCGFTKGHRTEDNVFIHFTIHI